MAHIDGRYGDVLPLRPASEEAAQRTLRLSDEAPVLHIE